MPLSSSTNPRPIARANSQPREYMCLRRIRDEKRLTAVPGPVECAPHVIFPSRRGHVANDAPPSCLPNGNIPLLATVDSGNGAWYDLRVLRRHVSLNKPL